MEIKLAPEKKSKRVYASTPPDVGAKISLTLKNLNAVTGMFSKKMKKVHSDPILHAQRVEAMKRAKRTPAARQHASNMMKSFFSNPENRLKRSLSMKGVKFYCHNCGEEGHRSHYCPSLKDTSGRKRYKCRLCGKSGHNRTTCKRKREHKSHGRPYNCTVCGQSGHNSKTCPQNDQAKGFSSQHQNQELPNNVNIISRQTIKCSICCERGHNARSCSHRLKLQNTKAQKNLLK
ncbi:uncharacterized protein LOC131078396 isoform X1 [Cryptomeria japonica]|uniref:uncharacterized protein LOC131078396 isoform X1 n=1 Tax=Cryptomeria japonica TaxID=3369 RepID=UPI0027DA6BC0|nr:uncharacterized protein LOC131078396 isoform X1 [Cryptomeria japonica]